MLKKGWLIFFLIVFYVFGDSSFSIPLSSNGKPTAVIVVSSDSSPIEQFAAQELKEYLDKITGGDFQIRNEKPSSGCAIILGDTLYTKKAGIDTSKMERDEFVIKVFKGDIYIAGKDERSEKAKIIFSLKENPDTEMKMTWREGRVHFSVENWNFDMGTLLGIYHFLEELGVRWFFPGPEGEVIPKNPDLKFDINKSGSRKPYYRLRLGGGAGYWPANFPEITKVEPVIPGEYKSLGWTSKYNMLWVIRMGGVGKYIAFNHAPPRTMWKERFATQHPEYFALLENGKRDLPENLEDRTYRYHLCRTHPGVLKETLNDIDAFFSGKPASERGITTGWHSGAVYGDTFSLLPHDSFRACRCPECSKLLREERGASGFASDLVWDFVRRVAVEVEKKWPGKYVTCLAYSLYTLPPAGFKKLPDNVIIGLCPFFFNKTYNTVNQKNLQGFLELAKEWDNYNNQPLLIWLHHLYRSKQPEHQYIPMHIPNHLAKLIKNLSPHAKYWHMELDYDSIFYEHINRYVVYKMLWDPTLNQESLVDDYIRRYYGPKVYEMMKEFYTDLERCCTKIAESGTGTIGIYEAYFNKKFIDKYEALFQEALKITSGTEYNKRVGYAYNFILGGIKKGYEKFKDRLSSGGVETVPVYFTEEPVKIDGILNEKAWEKARILEMVNNVDSEPSIWSTKGRLLWDKENIYFSFECYSPNIAKDIESKNFESVEIFVDIDNDGRTFHQILIKNNGEILDLFFDEDGLRDDSWVSGVQKAINIKNDGWIIEGTIPVKNLLVEGSKRDVIKEGMVCGVNLCRTLVSPPRPKDTFNTFSKMIVGRFAQPEMFAKMYFLKEPLAEEKIIPGNLIENGSFEKWESANIPNSWHVYKSEGSSVCREDITVHSGKHSIKIVNDKKDGAAQISKRILYPVSPQVEGTQNLYLSDGKYCMKIYWYSLKGSLKFSLRIKNKESNTWSHYNPIEKSWVTSERSNSYFIITGEPNKWNETTVEFNLNFPREHGYLILGVAGSDTLFLDDISVVRVQ